MTPDARHCSTCDAAIAPTAWRDATESEPLFGDPPVELDVPHESGYEQTTERLVCPECGGVVEGEGVDELEEVV